MAGYTRQSLADIQDGEDIVAAPLNAEFDQLQDAFNAITGHTHDGTIGNGPKININDSTTGTIDDGRLPSSMTGKTFTSDVTISNTGDTRLFITGTGNSIIEIGRTDGTPNLSLIDFHSSGNNIDYDSRIIASGGTGVVGNGLLTYNAFGGHVFNGDVQFNNGVGISGVAPTLNFTQTDGMDFFLRSDSNSFYILADRDDTGGFEVPHPLELRASTNVAYLWGNVAWHAGNMGPGSGLNADLLDGQDGLFYQNASNIISGTLNEARLPSTINGAKTFTSSVSVASLLTTSPNNGIELGPAATVNTPFIDFHSGGQSTDYDARILASGGGAGTGQGSLSITAGGGLNLLSTNLFGVGATFSNTVNGLNYVATDAFYVRNDSDRYIRFQTTAGVNRGAVVHNNTIGAMQVFTYNASGVFQHNVTFGQGGDLHWSGHYMRLGGATTSGEYQIVTNNTGHSYRVLGNNTGEWYLQRSNDRFVANAVTLLDFSNTNVANFYADIIGGSNGPGGGFLPRGAIGFGAGNGLVAGNGDAAAYSTHNIRLSSWNGIGLWDSSSAACRIVFNVRNGTAAFQGNLTVGGTSYQTDGNIIFSGGMAGYGDLNSALSSRAGMYTGSTQDETNFPLGHTVMMRSNSVTNRNQTALVFNSTDAYQYVGNSESSKTTQLSGTWRCRGYVDDASGGVGGYIFQRVG